MKLKMRKDKIDKHIERTLRNRELKPSASAWERLNTQLDQETFKKKKNRFFYINVAASVVLLASISFFYLIKDNDEGIKEEVIVDTVIDTLELKEFYIKDIIEEKVVVKVETTKKENVVKKENKLTKPKEIKEPNILIIAAISEIEKVESVFAEDQDLKILNEGKNKTSIEVDKKGDFDSKIKINSEDLLFAVTHTKEEVRAYYAKNKINRKDVLDTIQKELIKSDLKIKPEKILAEVEKTLEKEEFKGDFFQKIKIKISDIAVAITDRNK